MGVDKPKAPADGPGVCVRDYSPLFRGGHVARCAPSSLADKSNKGQINVFGFVAEKEIRWI